MIAHMKKTLSSCDISDAATTSFEAFQAPYAGRVYIPGCYVSWDVEATGAQTTQGVLSLEVGGVVVATLAATRSGSLGDCDHFSPDGTYTTAASPYAEFAAGDTIEVKVQTQAATNPEGDGYGYLALEYAV